MPLHHGGGDGPAPGTAGALRLRSDHAHSWGLLVTTEYPSWSPPLRGTPRKPADPSASPYSSLFLGVVPSPLRMGGQGKPWRCWAGGHTESRRDLESGFLAPM